MTVNTSDLSLDADGLIPAPVYNFKVVVASPDVATAPNLPDTSVELSLTLTVQHPCRGAVLTSRNLSPMTAYVHLSPDVQTVAPFGHSLETSSYDCGLQQLSVVQDPAGLNDYGEFITVST